MAFGLHIENGIKYILSHQNSDFGIPATKPGDPSGCWTTADCLETFLLTSYYPSEYHLKLRQLAMFLLDNQLSNGGWPLVKGGINASTMATGHAISSLVLFSKLKYKKVEINRSIEKGIKWIQNNQNHDGSWGVEPDNDNGKVGRMIAIFYALRGLFGKGYNYDNSRTVSNAINYLLNTKKDKGWAGIMGAEADISNTARAITCLVRSKKFNSKDKIIKSGLKYILKNKSKWNIDTESFVSSNAPGETVFNSNTPYDLIEAFCASKYYRKELYSLCSFFVNNQEDDGKWHLSYKKGKVIKEKNITTWSTSEAISALSLAQRTYLRFLFHKKNNQISKLWKYIFWMLIAVIIFQFGYIIDLHKTIVNFWISLTISKRNYIIYGVLITVLLSIFSNLLTPLIQKKFKKIINKIKEES